MKKILILNVSMFSISFVYIKNEVKKHKWDSPKLGPYKIVGLPSDQSVVINVDGTEKSVHKNKTSKSRLMIEEMSDDETRITNTCTFY